MTDRPIIIFDGECGLCNRSVRFILRHERDATLRFAAAQSAAGRALLAQHGFDPDQLNAMVFLRGGENMVRSDAALAVAEHLRRPYRWLSALRIMPRSVRDACYDWVARTRHRWFGAPATCRSVDAAIAGRFLQ